MSGEKRSLNWLPSEKSGGPAKPKKEDSLDSKIILLIKTSAVGLFNHFDSDSVAPDSLERHNFTEAQVILPEEPELCNKDKITASQFEKQDTIEYLEPIKDIINDSENIPSNHLPEQVSVMLKTEYSVNGQVQATVLPANRVKILEPGDVYQTPKLILPAIERKF
ncbi:unnamed protein product [Parnassius apollo]|uniref:(apollo) hypothetical protein n=1 Tax=Parnassius apollo TaxID=110799 RepID=A0A8S3WTU5_PARAO|nr:unnamed protein product [Parnassius apollo]